MFEEIGRNIDVFFRVWRRSWSNRMYWLWQRHVRGIEPPGLHEVTQAALQGRRTELAGLVRDSNTLCDRMSRHS